ncbi:hypothetical protein H5410_026435 [Solanum commersonii]|uniref:Uncharacterized protein n=1 Tax=Solanum commersonii TaxID=4109 RepID=A0A9J5YZ04_SOLCO|nr:hypothetical protein H5410_026435 [Solanum commersonii]
MEPVDPDGQPGPFSRSNEPQSRHTFYFIDFCTSFNTLAIESVGPDSQTDLFSRLYKPRRGHTPHFVDFHMLYSIDFLVIPKFRHLSYGSCWLGAKPAYFQGQTIPGAGIAPFYRFSCAIVHRFFGYPKFRCKKCQKFLWTFVKTLAMEPVDHDGQTVPFLRSNEPRSRHTTYFANFRVI